MKGPGPPAGRAGSAAGPVTPPPPPPPRPGPERPEPQKKIGAIGADSRNSAIFIVDRNFPNDTFSKESRFFETLRICKSEKAPFELIITWWARARNIGNLEVEILLCRCRCRCYAQTNQWALSPLWMTGWQYPATLPSGISRGESAMAGRNLRWRAAGRFYETGMRWPCVAACDYLRSLSITRLHCGGDTVQ